MNQPLIDEAGAGSPMAGEMSIGAALKALREAKQLTLNEVSSRLKFSIRQLEALESEQWNLLPSGVSLRGLVKNYGRYLETDVEALLLMLEEQVGSTRAGPVMASSPAPMAPTDIPIQAEPAHRPWGWLIIILFLLIVAGFYAVERGWVPDSWLVFDWLKSLKK